MTQPTSDDKRSGIHDGDFTGPALGVVESGAKVDINYNYAGEKPTSKRLDEWKTHVDELRKLDVKITPALARVAFLAIRNPLWVLPEIQDEPGGQSFDCIVEDLVARQFSTDGIPPLLKLIQLLATLPNTINLGSLPNSETKRREFHLTMLIGRQRHQRLELATLGQDHGVSVANGIPTHREHGTPIHGTTDQ